MNEWIAIKKPFEERRKNLWKERKKKDNLKRKKKRFNRNKDSNTKIFKFKIKTKNIQFKSEINQIKHDI